MASVRFLQLLLQNEYKGCLSVFNEESTDLFMPTKRLKTRREVEDAEFEYKTNGCTVYTHNLGPYLKAAVTYKYKKSPKTVVITSSNVYAGSPYIGHKPSFSGTSNISYDEGQELIQASCSGTLSFMDGTRKVDEDVQKVVFMIP